MKEKYRCSKCAQIKDASEFAFRNKTKGTRHSYCLQCGRFFAKDHYSRHTGYYVRKARTRRQALMGEINAKLFEYLEQNPCVDCGETDPVVLEFDHVRGKKLYNVSAMGALVLSWATILKEIEKCEVRCANCHRRRTAERSASYRHRRRNGPLAQFG
ncbi:MAG TPA: hypothetical protein VGB73_09135 [Pyrinomonadaceae bacterium]